MPATRESRTARIFVVLNANSGNASSEDVRRGLESEDSQAAAPHFHETAEGEDIVAATRAAVKEGYDLIIAAGGDGTVSAVANGLIGSAAAMAIIPLGTTNVLARELSIPLDVDEACKLIGGSGRPVAVDAMRVGDAHYFTQIGIGVDAYMIRDTKSAHKKWLGPLAYIWTAVTRLIGFQPRRFTILADGRQEAHRAMQVLLANCGTLGASPLRWGPDVRVNDGQIDICILRARTVVDYLALVRNFVLGRHRADRNVRYLCAHRDVEIRSDRPLPVQGDGEVIGETPLKVAVVPGALSILAPPPAAAS